MRFKISQMLHAKKQEILSKFSNFVVNSSSPTFPPPIEEA